MMEYDVFNETDRLISSLAEMDSLDEDYDGLFDQAMRALYRCPYLVFALSLRDVDGDRLTSKPLVSTKDSYPSLYVFTSLERGTNWCKYYEHYYDSLPLIGIIEKGEDEFAHVFGLAKQLGVNMLMVNEGDDYACLSLDEFVEKNGIGSALSIVLSEEEIREALETNTVRIRLPEVEILKVS
ncbi:MAG: hypothetical protein II704_05035 [Erysipelotrichaceae bacterium]|nr:hypothetical protein [Erysipelotrichaceae bacterium]